MTYLTTETSVAGSDPQELYRFSFGVSRYLYTSSDAEVTYMSEVYKPLQISRKALESSAELNKMKMEVEMPRDTALCQLFLFAAPGVVTITVYRTHRSDSDVVMMWKGRITGVEWGGITAKVICEPVFTSLQRPGLRGSYQKVCRHALYSGDCGVNNTSHFDLLTVLTVVGLTVTVGSISRASGYFTGGYIELAFQAKRMIRDHTGDVLVLLSILPSLKTGDTIRAFAGCDHSMGTCNGKFGNLDNYGGFPWIPTKNPFQGDGIAH